MAVAQNTIHPYIRILFLFGTIAFILLMQNPYYLGGLYLCFILPIILFLHLIKFHIRLFLFGIIPIFLTFILLYILVLDGTNGGWEFIFTKCLKILAITSTFQVALTIQPDMLYITFRKWGFRGDSFLTLLGAFTVWADINTRANQIIVARFARGFIGRRNLINTAKQLPYVLIPLIIGVIRTSIIRVEVWDQRSVPNLLDHQKISETHYPFLFNLLLATVPIVGIITIILLPYQ